MKRLILPGSLTTVLLAALVLWATGLAAMRAAPAPPPGARATVTYVNPEKFTEHRQFGMQDRFNRVDYLAQLQAYLIKRAGEILPPGQNLHVNITDIQLAGAYEPWRGPQWSNVRMMRDNYPPRIELDFQLTDDRDKVLREGQRVLRDLNYLRSGVSTPSARNESLYYEKALLERWLRGGPEKL